MDIHLDVKNSSKVAILSSNKILIWDIPSALDVMAQVQYETGSYKFIIKKENIAEEFFDLKTKLAGEVLQKFINYHVVIAVIGDFDVYQSNSLKDFIYECNKGRQIFFLIDEMEALVILHNIT